GKEGWVTNQQIAREFHGTGGNHAPLLPVVTLRAGSAVNSPAVLAGLRALEARVRQILPGTREAGYASTGSPSFVSADGRTTFIIAYPPPDPNQPFGDNPNAAKKARAALAGATVAGAPVHLPGFDALSVQNGGGNGPGVLLEAMLGGLGALVVLAFVFASFLAVVPIVMAIVSILTSFLVVWGLTTVTEISPIVQFLIALIGLGVAIDYTLLVVVRWREERAHGLQGDEAIVRAMETAGRAVVFSGTTVAIGLLALIALPLPFLRSVGYGGMLIPLVSVLVALTQLPAVRGVHGAVAPASPQWRHASAAVVEAFPVQDGSSGAGREAIDRIRDAAHASGEVRLGGLGAQNQDFISAVYGNFPLMIALIAI